MNAYRYILLIALLIACSFAIGCHGASMPGLKTGCSRRTWGISRHIISHTSRNPPRPPTTPLARRSITSLAALTPARRWTTSP